MAWQFDLCGDHLALDFANTSIGPSWASGHWFGTDTLGRDLMVRTMEGGRISLLVGMVATVVALAIGVIYGAIAGYLGGRVDAVMMRIVDILYALPFTIFVILLMVAFGRSIWLMFIAIGAVEFRRALDAPAVGIVVPASVGMTSRHVEAPGVRASGKRRDDLHELARIAGCGTDLEPPPPALRDGFGNAGNHVRTAHGYTLKIEKKIILCFFSHFQG